MNNYLPLNRRRRKDLLAAFISLCALMTLVVFNVQNKVQAQGVNERVVTVFDGEFEQTFVTESKTVGEALKKAKITLNQSDAVEPSINTELVARNYNINVYRARPVLVEDGMNRKTILSPHKSARQVIEKAGFTMHAEDEAVIERVDDVISSGAAAQKVIIDRSTPLQLILYGKKADSRTQADTVAELLKEKGVKLGPNDGMSATPETPITAGMVLEVWRDGTQTLTEEVPVAFPIEQIKDSDKEVGFKEVRTAGVNGKKMVTYEIEVKGGKEIRRKEIQSVVTLEPKKQVEVVGTKLTNTFSGSFAEALARLRSCEGSYTSNTGNGYYGAYQFDIQTWGGYKGYPNAAVAPPAVQDQKAWETYQRRGWQPWPSCKIKMGLQDIYR